MYIYMDIYIYIYVYIYTNICLRILHFISAICLDIFLAACSVHDPQVRTLQGSGSCSSLAQKIAKPSKYVVVVRNN